MKRILIALFSVLLILACNLSTPTAVVSSTPTLQTYPTVTITPLFTLTPPPSPTSTPDLRVITAPAQNFKLTLADLPWGYAIRYIPSCFDDTDPHCELASDMVEGPNLNYEVLQDYGFEKGSRYVNDTLRIEGWYILYSNEKGGSGYPQTIISNPIRFTNADGAKKFVETYEGALLYKYTQVEGYPSIGDSSRAFSRTYYNWKYFSFVFAYKNIAHEIGMIGTQTNITPDLVYNLAFKALKRLQAAELDFPSQFVSPPTLTPSADSSPGSDQRVIAAKPFDLALSELDLPTAGNYHLHDKYSSGPRHNSKVIQEYSGGKGSAFVNDTARVDGWVIRYTRGANDLLLPVEMRDEVAIFQTAEGAQKYIKEFSVGFFEEDWHEGIPQRDIGDSTRLFVKQDGVYIKYLIEFSYRNCVHSLQGYGLHAEIDPAFMEMTAFNLLRKLQSVPLSTR